MTLLANTGSKVQACSRGSTARPCLLPRNRLVMSRRRFVRATPEERSSSEEAPQSTPSSGASGTGAAAAAVALSKAPAEETSPFLDPLVRSLILGVGAGILCETAHVVTKALTLFESGGLPSPFSSGALQQFSPAFTADHAVAIGAWLLLYAVEAAAIMGVMRRNPGKPSTELAAQLSGLPLLPRKIFPASLTSVKDAVAHTLAASAATAVGGEAGSNNPSSSEAAATAAILSAAAAGDLAQAQAVAAAAPSAIVASPPGLSKELEKTLDDIEAAAAGRVLDRPGAPQAEPVRPPQAGPDAPVRPPQAGPMRPKEQLQRRQQQAAERGLSKRDKELRDRRSYLKNFWYAAALSDKVTADKPLGVDILGSRLSLFRDEAGKVVALDDACPHRGAPLSDGWTATDKDSGKKCAVCPYHGWAFDSSGKLRDVPSAEKGSWPKRPLVGSYAVEERGGFVWLFYGSPSLPAEERPPIPTTPELEDPAWRAVYGEIEFECGHWGVFENAIDMAHIHYLHGDSFGNSEKPKVMDMTSSRDTFETTCNFRIHNKPVNKLWEWTAVPSVPVTAKAMLPSTSAVTIELAHGVKMITFVNTVPINEHRAINRFCLIRNFATHPAFDWMARDNMYKILGEDKVMVDKLAPERLPAEYSLGPDLPQIAFRQLRQEWIDMGYGVPPESELPRRGLLPDTI